MDTIYIPQLATAPEQTESIQVNQSIRGLKTLTPVQGQMEVTHRGRYLDVRASVVTITTLTCDRCLQNYNHRLTVDASELIWLDEPPSPDEEMADDDDLISDDLVETVPSTGYFDPETWLYEYLCLALPQQQLCDRDCEGIPVNNDVDDTHTTPVDSRWGALENLKSQLLN
jgi:uncharacterized protein